jgi:hypothetical protein
VPRPGGSPARRGRRGPTTQPAMGPRSAGEKRRLHRPLRIARGPAIEPRARRVATATGRETDPGGPCMSCLSRAWRRRRAPAPFVGFLPVTSRASEQPRSGRPPAGGAPTLVSPDIMCERILLSSPGSLRSREAGRRRGGICVRVTAHGDHRGLSRRGCSGSEAMLGSRTVSRHGRPGACRRRKGNRLWNP